VVYIFSDAVPRPTADSASKALPAVGRGLWVGNPQEAVESIHARQRQVFQMLAHCPEKTPGISFGKKHHAAIFTKLKP
jgi:hypothetical protein